MTTSDLLEIYKSFRALPLWVQVWMLAWLVPVNLASLYFLSEPLGVWIALLAILGMAPNVLIVLRERGFSKLMALPHILPWTALVAIVVLARPEQPALYVGYLVLLAATNFISLLFDYPDAIKWLRGDRAVSGRPDPGE